MATNVNPLDMSDEDFLNMPRADIGNNQVAPNVDNQDEAVQEAPQTGGLNFTPKEYRDEEEYEEEQVSNAPSGSATASDDEAGNGEDDAGESEPASGSDTKERDAQGRFVKADAKPKEAEASEPEEAAQKPDDKPESGEAPAPVNYEEAYKKIMAPFKANGKTITLNNPDEVVQLMQRGANYTKKMQALQPSMKILRMLQDNGLHDEDAISHVIDIMKGDKGAIQHLLKQKGVDVLDFDNESGKQYTPGNHKISDGTMNLIATLSDITETDHGKEIVAEAQSWDRPSKEAIFANPQVLELLARHRADGYYDQITGEIEKQRALGNSEIARLPFLHAYKVVGDAMEKQGLLRPPVAVAPQPEQVKAAPQVLAKQPAPRKNVAPNSDKVKAASPTQISAKKAAGTPINPLAMSDDEWLKQMQNRV